MQLASYRTGSVTCIATTHLSLTSCPSDARLKVDPRGVLSGSPYSEADERAVHPESLNADEPRGMESVSLRGERSLGH